MVRFADYLFVDLWSSHFYYHVTEQEGSSSKFTVYMTSQFTVNVNYLSTNSAMCYTSHITISTLKMYIICTDYNV